MFLIQLSDASWQILSVRCPLENLQYDILNPQTTYARTLRVVSISDTHNTHRSYTKYLPAADILIHCGDLTKYADISTA